MRILFSMRHSGALRNFASTIEALARDGHQVHLVFMMPDKRGDGRLLRALQDEHPGITVGEIVPGRRRGLWHEVARAVRTSGDYVRYRTSDYAGAHALRARAAARVPPIVRATLDHPPVGWTGGLRLAARLFRLAEEAIPVDPEVSAAIAGARPDVVLVTPLVDLGSAQVEYLKAARALGIRSGLAVHSWDNLTNKGVLRIVPDRVFVWNDAQRREAETMHGVPPDRVVVTGAPVYDQWFDRRPSTTREAFCATVGLRADRPVFLYLCSSRFIAADEPSYVERWIAAVRSAPDVRVREAGLLVRPHPDNLPPWQTFDTARHAAVAVWPRGGGEPVDRATRDDYFDSMYHAAAAVGVNTSAQVEAGIVGLPVHTIRDPEFAGTQDGTLHFRHLLPEHGGLLHVADDLGQHVEQLARSLDERRETGGASEFVRSFVRPYGDTVAATPRLAAAIAELGGLARPAPARTGATRLAFRAGLYALGLASGSGGPGGRGDTKLMAGEATPRRPGTRPR